jgi:hypothetical protein
MGAAGRWLRRSLRDAHRRWPTVPFWPLFLATSYTRLAWRAPAGTEARRRYAAEAIRWYEREEGLWPRDPVEWRNPEAEAKYTRLRNRGTMASLAVEIGDCHRAERWAEEALQIPDAVAQIPWRSNSFPPDVSAVHVGNIVLGKIALERTDLDEAERRLARAGTSLASEPDFSLAQALLERGRRHAVVAYLDACREMWIVEQEQIEGWITQIHRGDTPDLEPWWSSKPPLRLKVRALGRSLRALRKANQHRGQLPGGTSPQRPV